MALTIKSVNKVFQNKIVLYILLGLCLLNLLGYLAKNNLSAIIIFLLAGYSTTFFTKNMSYILLVPLLLTNFIITLFSSQKLSLKEGMKNDKRDSKSKKSKKENKHDNHNNDDNDDNNHDDNDDNDNDEIKGGEEKTYKKGTHPALAPEAFDDNDDNDDDIVNTKIQKQKNIENAYQNLESIMGSKNFNNMSGGIKQLAGDQDKLLSVIEKMEPIMDKAGGMLDKFNNSKLAGMLPKIMGGKNKEDE